MSVKDVKTLLSNIQSTHGGYDEAEKISAGIIKAAIENGLVQFVQVVDDHNKRYYQFKIVGLDQVYEVCFGFNPPAMGAHSHAERALRSSDFIMTLQGLIDKDYNCYVVPSVDISGPDADVLCDRIFGKNSDVKIQKGQAKRRADSNVSYRSVYELEVAINAAVDYRGDNGEAKYECVRINDSVVVEANVTDGKLNASYVCKTLDKKEKAESLDNVSIKEDQLLIVKKVLAHVKSNAEKRKILECLASSEESGFYKEFLGNLSNWKDVQVGQVSVKPCFVFVDKIPCKTFDYSVQLGNSLPAFGLKLTWNDLDTRFNEKTPLYIVADREGRFEGLTYEKNFEQNGKMIERAEYRDCKLVAAYGKDGKPVLTLAPTNQSDFDIKNDNFKGIKDWAVQLTGTENKDKYYLRSCVRKIEKQKLGSRQLCEGGVYLESDCAQCDYLDGAPWMWKGDLSEKVDYIDRNGREAMGRIPKKLLDTLKRECPCCGKEYYAESDPWKKYQKNYKLLDGNYSCSACKDDYTTIWPKWDDVTWAFADVYKKGFKVCMPKEKGEKVIGKALGEVKKEGDEWKLVETETLYYCKECGVLVYKAPNRDLDCGICGICGTRYCLDCYENNSGKFFNVNKFYCKNCKDGQGYGNKKIIKNIRRPKASWNDNVKEFGAVWDNERVESAVHCAGCGELIFYNPWSQGSYAKCVLCKRILEKACEKKLKDGLCPSCNKKENGYKSEWIKLNKRKAAAEAADAEAKKCFEDYVWKKIKRFAVYFNLSDRRYILRERRKKANRETVIQFEFEEEAYPTVKGKKRRYVRFWIVLKNRNKSYKFACSNRKITLEEINYGRILL